MHRRVLIAAYAALLMVPALAGAQQQMMGRVDDPSWLPRVRVTPFVGYLTGIERQEEWYGPDDQAVIQMQIDGGPAVGVNLDSRLFRNWGASGAFSYAKRGRTMFGNAATGEQVVIDGSHLLTARLGPAYYVGEDVSGMALHRLNAAAFAGAVLMVDMPGSEYATAEFVDDGLHFGMAFGINAEMPFASDRFAVQLGIEDNVMWWDESQQTSLAFAYFDRPNARLIQYETVVDVSHTWLLRAGLSFRFR